MDCVDEVENGCRCGQIIFQLELVNGVLGRRMGLSPYFLKTCCFFPKVSFPW